MFQLPQRFLIPSPHQQCRQYETFCGLAGMWMYPVIACQKPGDPCLHRYHTRSTVALGFVLVCHTTGAGMAYLQPSAVDQSWSLKPPPPPPVPTLCIPSLLGRHPDRGAQQCPTVVPYMGG